MLGKSAALVATVIIFHLSGAEYCLCQDSMQYSEKCQINAQEIYEMQWTEQKWSSNTKEHHGPAFVKSQKLKDTYELTSVADSISAGWLYSVF